jgi:hypothetical protein
LLMLLKFKLKFLKRSRAQMGLSLRARSPIFWK